MTKIHCVHDKGFKNLMADVEIAKNFFQKFLPKKIQKQIDFNTLSLCRNSFVDADLSSYHADVLYEVLIGDSLGYLYLLCEHQSTVDELLPYRIVQYIVKIWEQHLQQNGTEKIPLVIPLVFYHGKKPYDKSVDIKDLIDAPVELIDRNLFKFQLIDTNLIADEDLREESWTNIIAFVLKHVLFRDFPNHVDKILSQVLKRYKIEEHDPRLSNRIGTLFRYIFSASDMDPYWFMDKVRKFFPPSLGEQVMKAADYLRDEGRLEGQLEYGANTLIELLCIKFGTEASRAYLPIVKKASISQIDVWVKRILTAKTVDEMFEEETVH